MSKFTVGVIGNGFVGESQAFAFSPTCEIKIFDKNPLKSINTLNEVLESDFIFVCVPTPMKKDGNQDFSFIENVFENAKKGPIYIIKSTVLPGSTKKLQDKFNELDSFWYYTNENSWCYISVNKKNFYLNTRFSYKNSKPCLLPKLD